MSLQIEPSLFPFFKPRGVVIVGASQNPTKLGFGLARNLLQSGYEGAVHFVNPKGGTLLERPIYPTIADVPQPADLAILLIPASLVPQGLIACGQRGIQAVIIASGGFRETGPAGAELEDECLRIAQDYNMRLIGPNCIGLLDTHLPLDTTFLPPPGPTPGAVAFISHSGAICAAVIDWARGQGFGLSQLVSLGNQIDVRETDVLGSVAADPHTRVITLYLEGVSDGRHFVRAAAQVTREKPVLALKVGRFASGQRAVASHTGALAGSEAAFEAAFRRAGVIRANTSEELFDWARALAWCKLPQGRRVAVLTNAGGPAVTAADALEAHGLQLADLSAETKNALRQFLPQAASVNNPVDLLAGASPEDFAHSLRHLLADEGVDSVIVIFPPPPMYAAGGIARAIIPIIYAAQKPVIAAVLGERMIQEAVEYFRAARVVEYRFPERAAAALAVLVQRAEYLASQPETPQRVVGVSPERVHHALRQHAGIEEQPGFLPQEVVEEMLTAYGMVTPPLRLAETAVSAAQLADEMGYPVALKVASPDIPHKSDVGGVRLNLLSATQVEAAFVEMMAQVETAVPAAHIAGIHVQRMIPQGQEVIVGAVQDPQFGPMVMFGSGGVEVEGLQDVTFALAPLTRAEAQAMLQRTWAGRKLQGFRNIPAADQDAVVDAILRLGQLVADFPQIQEIEINPLRVMQVGQGAFAVDARARVG
ncbi:MAG: acetate--CoA ligase family protein [Ardenticatenaceae bacterium]|nr:acetate--CoA ligase family protein [Ardenticatenaceae bacterium]